jgi:hypothetical protein
MPNQQDDWCALPTNFAKTESQGSTEGLRFEITSKLGLIQEVYRRVTGNRNYQINIRAGQEWNSKHGLFSLHHTGFAVDVRTSDLAGGGVGPLARQIAGELQSKLGNRYFVLLHKPPDPPHIHVQYSAGIRMSSPGDWPRPSGTSRNT